MPVPYSVSAHKNPIKPDEPAKYYATAQSSGTATFKDIATQIGDRCTVTASDAKAVLDALVTVMQEHLSKGRIVQFNDLGSFRVSLSSRGTAKEEELLPARIKGAKIIFRPELDLKKSTKVFTFEKVALLPKKVKQKAPEA